MGRDELSLYVSRRLMEKLTLQAGAEIARRGERQSLTNTIQSKFKTNLPIVATARKSFATCFGTLKLKTDTGKTRKQPAPKNRPVMDKRAPAWLETPKHLQQLKDIWNGDRLVDSKKCDDTKSHQNCF